MPDLYANVIVDISHEKLDRTFQYRVPEALADVIRPGTAVEIPFGNGNRRILGYVLELSGEPLCDPARIKEIGGVSEAQTGVEGRLIALAAWMRDYYGSTMIQALKAVLPVRHRTKEKRRKQIRLLLGEEEAQAQLASYEKKHHTARARLLAALLARQDGVLPWETAVGSLKITTAVTAAMEEQGVIRCESSRVYRTAPVCGEEDGRPVMLNPGQRAILNAVEEEWDTKKGVTYLIHGVTGSGKTEVYMELIACALKRNQQAILLIPEIALTYQTVRRFYRRFGERVCVLHSRLSAGERSDQYERARDGQVDIMIGPRSALFAPFSRLGIIIIDEEHEESYKSESAPRYHVRETAQKRASLEGARVVLGSATPSVESYYRAKKGMYRLFTLPERVQKRPLASVAVADMREELKHGNRGILSTLLQERMKECLQKGEQIMLFLNRRGYAGFVACRACGEVIGCPHCSVSLALHEKGKSRERLVCHYCGYEQRVPARCPVCDSPYIGDFQVGTQQAAEKVQQLFPRAKILRMDTDTTRAKDGHVRILSAFADGEADILVGTQMIVKGHDFPNVTLVGALAADLSLHVNDYTAAERTFQLLTQAAGRAGRGRTPGQVVIQTYVPDHYSIVAAAGQNYEEFYRKEIAFRALMGYPPVGGMFVIHGAGEQKEYLRTAMEYLKRYLHTLDTEGRLQIVGPADEVISKVSDVYRKVLYVRHENPEFLMQIRKKAEQYIAINRGFDSLTMQFDREG